MLVLATMGVAMADCAARPVAAELAPGDAAAMVLRLDGDVTVVPSADDRVRVEACGGSPRLAVKDGVVTLSGRPVVSATVWVPAAIAAVTAHQHDGPLAVGVPARVAVVSGSGPVRVTGADSLRVAWHTGDVAVDGVTGDLVVDRVDGALQAVGVGGEAQVDGVTGAVSVDAADRPQI